MRCAAVQHTSGATALFELCLKWRGIGQDQLAAEGAQYAMRLRSEFERLREALLMELATQDRRAATALSRQHEAPHGAGLRPGMATQLSADQMLHSPQIGLVETQERSPPRCP